MMSVKTNQFWRKWLPYDWLTRAGLSDDVVAGIITGLILIPQALAYASLAGLPAHIGLYASLLPPMVYAIFASSKTMSVGPVSVAAIMIADAYRAAAVHTTADAVTVSITLAFEIAIILWILRALKLGVINSLLSHTVLSGFTSAAAILIIFSQLDKITGVNLGELGATFTNGNYDVLINPYTLATGVAFIIGAIILKKLLSSAPGKPLFGFIAKLIPLAILILGIVAVNIFPDTANIKIVGAIPSPLPNFKWVVADLSTWRLLIPPALAIALIAYIESLSVARILAEKNHQRVDANKELFALSAANLASGLSGSMPVAGGFSRSMVNDASGAKTQRATLVTVGVILLAALFAKSFMENIPYFALAAIIILAVAPLIDLKTLKHTWRYDQGDALVIAVTFFGVLSIGLEFGLLLGVLSAFILYFKRTLQPHIAELGRLPGRTEYRNILRHSTEQDDKILILRIDENLYFANIDLIETTVLSRVALHKNLEHLILVLNATNHIDSHALHRLETLTSTLRDLHIAVHCVEVKGPLQDRLRKVNFEQRLSAGHFFMTIQDVIDYIHSDQSTKANITQ
ncbi:MAG: sodium-independent anion transporter [Gammaproteobacteria bacterium]|nr:MAG: sodium-independent anion transporter [Gammaproteobacteria bacterium]